MTYAYDNYNNSFVKTKKRMKHYRIYVEEPKTGDYHFQQTKFGTLTDVLDYCKRTYQGYKGEICNEADTKVLRRF